MTTILNLYAGTTPNARNIRLATVYETVNTVVEGFLANELERESATPPTWEEEDCFPNCIASIPEAVRAAPIDLTAYFRQHRTLAGAPLPYVGETGRQELEILLGQGPQALAHYMLADAHVAWNTAHPVHGHLCCGRRVAPLFERRDISSLGLSDNRWRALEESRAGERQ